MTFELDALQVAHAQVQADKTSTDGTTAAAIAERDIEWTLWSGAEGNLATERAARRQAEDELTRERASKNGQ